METNFKTPILFLIFNRPDVSQEVFNQIKIVKPMYLYVAADGPRTDRTDDTKYCKQTREIINQVDWECDLKTLFRNENLGCGKAVSGAISWFFDQVECGIILEDDCMPDLSFFPYCEELLIKYKADEQVMLIGGNNFQNGIIRGKGSYYFSHYPHIWGWATWRRAWQHYDFSMKNIEYFFNTGIYKIFRTNKEIRYWKKKLDKVISGKINTWDYQWVYSIWINNGIAITPNTNLVINLGIRNSSTHTFLHDSYKEVKDFCEIKSPLVHPFLKIDKIADTATFNNVFGHNLRRIIRLLKENKLLFLVYYTTRTKR